MNINPLNRSPLVKQQISSSPGSQNTNEKKPLPLLSDVIQQPNGTKKFRVTQEQPISMDQKTNEVDRNQLLFNELPPCVQTKTKNLIEKTRGAEVEKSIF